MLASLCNLLKYDLLKYTSVNVQRWLKIVRRTSLRKQEIESNLMC